MKPFVVAILCFLLAFSPGFLGASLPFGSAVAGPNRDEFPGRRQGGGTYWFDPVYTPDDF